MKEKIHDPWANYAPTSKMPRVNNSADTSHAKHLESVSTTVDRKIAAALAQVDQKLSVASGDNGMTDEVGERVGSMEARLTQIEQVVQTQQHQMQAHQSHVNSQLSSMKSQIDQQAQVFQNHLDSRMDEQLSQIEKLLGKKSRYE